MCGNNFQIKGKNPQNTDILSGETAAKQGYTPLKWETRRFAVFGGNKRVLEESNKIRMNGSSAPGSAHYKVNVVKWNNVYALSHFLVFTDSIYSITDPLILNELLQHFCVTFLSETNPLCVWAILCVKRPSKHATCNRTIRADTTLQILRIILWNAAEFDWSHL